MRDISEPRNYLDSKYHRQTRLLSKKEINDLTDVLFNYALVKNGQSIREYNVLGCDCIENEYPNFILLFKKNGKFTKYISLPIQIYKRSNFSDDELIEMDFLNEEKKEKLIMKLFKMEKRENFTKNASSQIIIEKR